MRAINFGCVLIAFVCLTGCGGGGGGNGGVNTPPPSAPAPSGLSYTAPSAPLLIGESIAPLTPTVTGTVSSYNVAPALPQGLTLSSTTGAISGAPTVEASGTYVVTASNSTGSTTFSLPLEVVPRERTESASAGTLTLANINPADFVPLSSSVRFDLAGASLPAQPEAARVFRNDEALPASVVRFEGSSIVLDGALAEGPNVLLVIAEDSQGKALSTQVTLWAGAESLQVFVLTPAGTPALSAKVGVRLGDSAVVTKQVDVVNGFASFENLPDRTIILTATGPSNTSATLATNGGIGTAQLRLVGFQAPSPVANNNFSLGTAGWTIGTGAPVSIVGHEEEVGGDANASATGITATKLIAKRSKMSFDRSGAARAKDGPVIHAAALDPNNPDMMLGTSGEGPRTVTRTFNVAPGSSSVTVRYRFVTSEVPGGFFGSAYNDSFSVSVRSEQGGGSASDARSMNGIGLAAFDASGSTGWLELSLPVSVAGDTIQADISVSNVGDGAYDSQIYIDNVSEDKLQIAPSNSDICAGERLTLQVQGSPAGTINWSDGGAPATGTGASFTTSFSTAGAYTIRATQTSGSTTQTASREVQVSQLSGAAWVARFPTSTSTTDLVEPFGANVDSFLSALSTAGATRSISATLRPPERAYLMHYAYRIAQEGLDPASVEAREGVDICWLHRNANGDPDVPASRAAAQAMVNGYGIAYAPALNSRHTEGRAIDVTIGWSGTLSIVDGDSHIVEITTTPRTGAGNTDLHAVGASFDVIKLVGDPPHWSDDGH